MNTNHQRHSLILDYTLDHIVEENEDEINEEEEHTEIAYHYDEDEMVLYDHTESLQNLKLKYMMALNENLRLPQHRSSLHYYQLHYLSEEEPDESCSENVPEYLSDEEYGDCGVKIRNGDNTENVIDRHFSPHPHGGLATKLSTSQIMSKVSSCFICGEQFDFNVLNEHEKSCLENIKSNDVQYTRQNTDEQVSSISSKAESLSLSNNSNHSSSSTEPSDKTKLGRCYICGDDIPTYLKGIHEKSCKKSWESGLLNSDRRTSVRADVFRSLSRSGSRADVNSNEAKPGNLRKSKSTTLYRSGSSANTNNISRDSIDSGFKTPTKKSSNNISKSSTDITKSATNLRKSNGNLSTSISNLDKNREPFKNGGVNSHFASTLRTSSCSSNSDISNKKAPPNRSRSATPMRNYRSISNLKQEASNKSFNKSISPLDKTKSLQDLRKASPSPSTPSNARAKSPADKKRGVGTGGSPQYVVCHLCGKLYSQHSIIIHVKQCEKTIDAQKIVGTNVDYKIKSQSLADLRKGKTSNGAIGRSPSSVLQKNKETNNKTTDSKNRSSSLSSSTSNLTQNGIKKQEGSESPLKENIPSTDVNLDRNDSVESDNSVSTPGLQKCYLCGQLYGTRSLPIHQKQCYLKQERLREAETNTKKKKKRDIKVIPFGKAKYSDSNTTSQPSSPPRFFQFPSRSVGRSNSSVTSPPRATSVDSLFSRTDSELSKDSDKESNEQTESPRRLGYSESSSGNESISPTSFKDVMMTCVHCGCQCEPYTMTIHEKVCRKVALDDVMMTSSEPSTGDLSPSGEEISRRGFIGCEGCGGEFSSAEIFQHRINCRTSIL